MCRSPDNHILGPLGACEPNNRCEDVAEKRPDDWIMDNEL